MSNVVEGAFGKPKEIQEKEELVAVDEADIDAVEPAAQFLPFERPFIGSYGIITNFDNHPQLGKMVIVRGQAGPDIGMPEKFLRPIIRQHNQIRVGDYVVLGQMADGSIGPVGVRRVDALSTNFI